MSNSFVFVCSYLVLQLFWLWGAHAANYFRILTVSQMQAQGISKGLPYFMHFGMWNDVVVVHPWVALSIGLFGVTWVTLVPGWLLGCAIAALIISWGANIAWTRHKDIVEAHGWDGRMSLIGMIHIPHMTIIVTVVLMTIVWFCKDQVSWKFFAGSAFLLLGHVCMGFHWPVKIFNSAWNPFPVEPWIGAVAILYSVFTSLGLFFLFWNFLPET